MTSGERRLQRYYPAVPPRGGLPDFEITGRIAQLMEIDLEARYVSLVLFQIAEQIPGYAGMTYQKLAEVTEQWPIIGRQDLYYGGTGYDNHLGLGKHITTAASRGDRPRLPAVPDFSPERLPSGALPVVPITRLYDRSNVMLPADLLQKRLVDPELSIHPETAAQYGFSGGETIRVSVNGVSGEVIIKLDTDLPLAVALLPRSTGLPLDGSTILKVPAQDVIGD
jgi:predicted molibdopterin-dependent oxidoreductase YjgC